jgi:hypothetical protein
VVGFAISDKLEIVFDTLASTRKRSGQSIRHRPSEPQSSQQARGQPARAHP